MHNLPPMQTVDPQITDIEDRAKAAKIPMTAILTDADVQASTWWRWRHAKAEPRLATLRKVRQALETRLAEQAAA